MEPVKIPSLARVAELFVIWNSSRDASPCQRAGVFIRVDHALLTRERERRVEREQRGRILKRTRSCERMERGSESARRRVRNRLDAYGESDL
jgi:hypothetical protein